MKPSLLVLENAFTFVARILVNAVKVILQGVLELVGFGAHDQPKQRVVPSWFTTPAEVSWEANGFVYGPVTQPGDDFLIEIFNRARRVKVSPDLPGVDARPRETRAKEFWREQGWKQTGAETYEGKIKVGKKEWDAAATVSLFGQVTFVVRGIPDLTGHPKRGCFTSAGGDWWVVHFNGDPDLDGFIIEVMNIFRTAIASKDRPSFRRQRDF